MVADTIRERLHRESFEPFRVRSSSGEAYTVASPDLVVLMRTEIFAEPNSDRWAQLPYLHVAAVENLTNGHPKRRRPRR